MSRPVRDEDLLAWIEGEATPEQAAQIEAAIAEDARLRAWATGAQADRDMLRAWGEPGASIAPPDLVEQAIAMAERSALLDAPADGLYELKTQRGPFRLFTPARLSIAAGLLIAVSAGILATPALQGGRKPIVAPAPGANELNQQPRANAGESAGLAEGERQLAMGGRDEARAAEPTANPLEQQIANEVGRLASAAPTSSSNELSAPVPEDAPKVMARLPVNEEADGGADALNQAVRNGQAAERMSSDLAAPQLADAGGSEFDDGALAKAEASDSEKFASEEDEALPQLQILALADEAAGWEGVAPQRRNLPAPVLIDPNADGGVTGRDSNGVESMSLAEAETLAHDGLLVVQAFVDDADRYAAALKAQAAVSQIELRDEPMTDAEAQRVLAVLGRSASIEDLLRQVTGAGVQAMSLTRAAQPVATPVDFSSIAWWALPVDQWDATPSQAVLVEILGDDAPAGGPNR
jgi:hypothetical protein